MSSLPQETDPSNAPLPEAGGGVAFAFWRSGLLLGLTALLVALCLSTSSLGREAVAGVVMDLPGQVGDWYGVAQGVADGERLILPADTEIARKKYESPQRETILCSIVLSGSQKRSIHRPEECLPAQGWTLLGGEVVSVALHSGRTRKVMALIVGRPIRLPTGEQKELRAYYLYWFVGDGVTTPNHLERVWRTAWDRAVHHINHRWAYVNITAPILGGLVPGGKDEAQTLAMLEQFIADVVPSVEKEEGAVAGALSPPPTE